MKYGLIANPEKEECIEFARKIVEKLNPVVEMETAKALGIDGIPIENMDVDVINIITTAIAIIVILERFFNETIYLKGAII